MRVVNGVLNPDEPKEDNGDIETPVSETVPNADVKIWSFEKTIFVENGGQKIEIVDMSGHRTFIKNDSQRVEIPVSKTGIYIVRTNGKTQKIIIY